MSQINSYVHSNKRKLCKEPQSVFALLSRVQRGISDPRSAGILVCLKTSKRYGSGHPEEKQSEETT